MFGYFAFLGVSLMMLSGNYRSFVGTASVPNDQGSADNSVEDIPRYMDDAVKELQNLKNTVGSTLEMMKTHSEMYTNFNGQEKGHSETKEQLNEDGRLIARIGQDVDQTADSEGKPQGRVRTKVDIPSKGIHKTLIHHLNNGNRVHVHGQKEKSGDEEEKKMSEVVGNRRNQPQSEIFQSDLNNEKIPTSQYGGIQYSPLDMAEYVFWTGDEKRVTLAIEEFLQEGLITREEAIAFLQDIKYNLDYLQNHYNQMGLKSKEIEKETLNNPYISQLKSTTKPLNDQFKYEYKPEMLIEKKNVEIIPDYTIDLQKQIMDANKEEEVYGELLERLRVADFLYTEYSLEEVIYQLAKVMFTQSLTRGSTEAQQALQKFTGFLESEANQGRISRALEKKVLDVLIAALTDTLSEHPEVQEADNSRTDQQNVMNELLKYNAKQKIGKIDANKAGFSHLDSFGVGKYKNP